MKKVLVKLLESYTRDMLERRKRDGTTLQEAVAFRDEAFGACHFIEACCYNILGLKGTLPDDINIWGQYVQQFDEAIDRKAR